MHRLSYAFVLGYHGCDQSVSNAVLQGKPFKPSNNAHDWLGPGIYFWEANPYRGLEWAHEQSRRPRSKIKVPAVVGAVIDMGSCLDLSTKDSLDLVKVAYDDLTANLSAAGAKLPVNSKDKLRRNLDCAVINRLHFSLTAAGYEPIQTVKGVFPEGGELYFGSGFEKKTHIQIAVVDPACIKGVFLPQPYPTL